MPLYTSLAAGFRLDTSVAKGKAFDEPKTIGGKEEYFQRQGMRQIGYAKLVVGAGAWFDPAKFLILSTRYNWDNDPSTKLGDKKTAIKIKRAMQ